ncbi:hypothetical protein SH584_11545 [Sphingomonas sp. LY29]|uniref:hypothetical protein n=1 Tax=Sphingomonas sp. LY29 TaxID=3095341 RepID=UPI002D79A158|nr:hypothetical protein [Sphingomonas sp. LY29]WRP25665.1 hypothetical protein SH584_11545 [Sphingomonas sp. LY29]
MLMELRVLNVAIWLAVFIYMIPGAWAASFGRKHTRYGDPMRLAVQGVAFVMVGFNLRWLFAPNDQATWAGLYIMSAALGIYIAYLARVYGRGKKL